jgi:hypothetical protein
MKQIWKYEIPLEKSFRLDVPSHNLVLSVQMQNEVPCVWILVDPDAPKEPKLFHLYWTGVDLGWIGKFIGTIQTPDGLVWHLFED